MEPGKAGTVGACALDTDQPDRAERRDETEELVVACRGRGNLQVPEPGTGADGEHGNVVGVLVCVDSRDDRGVAASGGCCHDGGMPS